MKIGIVALNWRIGGSETWSIELYKALTKYTNHKVRFLILTPSGRPKKDSVARDFFEYYPMSLKAKKTTDTIKELKSFDIVQLVDMGHYDIDHVHFNKFAYKSRPYYFDIIKHCKKVVGVWHITPDYEEVHIFPYCRKLNKEICTTSFAIRPKMAKLLKVPYIPHMIGTKTFDFKKQDLAISTARVTSSKGQMYLIRAADKIQGDVFIYGYGNNRYAWQCQQEPNYELSNIRHLKEFFLKSKKSLYKDAKVLVNLTRFKDSDGNGTEYTMLEAWKYGCSVIIDNNWSGGYIDSAVLKVDRSNPDDIAEKINLLFKEKTLRDTLIRNGREILKNHSAKKVVKKIIKLYKEVV